MRAHVVTVLAVAAGLLVPGLVSAQGIADVAKREKSRLEQSNQPPKVYTNDSFGGASPSEAAQKPPAGDAKPAAAVAPAAASQTTATAPAAAVAPAAASQTTATAPAPAAPKPVTPPAPAAATTRPAPALVRVASASSPGGAEAYWRGRAEAAQSAVDGAQARVDQLEAEASQGGESPSDASTGPCAQAVEDAKSGRKSRRTSGKRACDVEVMRARRSQELDAAIDDARKQLDAARDAQDALREEARRAGARADWLR